jgi:hypothetical protein
VILKNVKSNKDAIGNKDYKNNKFSKIIKKKRNFINNYIKIKKGFSNIITLSY